jgi:hypothetical protein
MPDETLIAKAMTAAGGIAAVVALLFSWPWRSPSPRRASIGWALGAAAGVFIGLWLLDVRPTGTLSDPGQRFLLIVIPAVVTVELVAALTQTKWAWVGRFAVAVGILPTILWGTTYLTDSAGPDTREWSPTVAAGISLAIGTLATLVWAGLVRLRGRGTGRIAWLGFGALCALMGFAVVYAGYITGLYFGFAAAAILIGPAIATLLVKGPVHPGALGIAMATFVSLLVFGRFLQPLTTAQTLLLAGASLGFVVADLLPAGPWLRAAVGAVLLAVPAGFGVMQAKQDAIARSIPPNRPTSPTSGTMQDYLDYGK